MITESVENLLAHIKTMATDEEINSLLNVKKTTIVHVGKEPRLQKTFTHCNYEFYDYTNFDEDNWRGLFIRVNYFAISKGADLIIFDFERVDMINQSEFDGLSMETKCIVLSPTFPAPFISDATNFLITLDNSANGKRPMPTKNLASKAKEIITKLLRL